jgi:hypothetical protein
MPVKGLLRTAKDDPAASKAALCEFRPRFGTDIAEITIETIGIDISEVTVRILRGRPVSVEEPELHKGTLPRAEPDDNR